MIRRLVRPLLIAMYAVLAGCAHYHYPINVPLERYTAPAPSAVDNGRAEDLLVVLAFSGGGSRAAALSYGVLETLANTTVVWDGRPRRLLDEVDVISAVSGGSVTAAYYGLYGRRIFEDFEQRFLNANYQNVLAMELAMPSQWARLASPLYDRVDMMADYFDENLFGRATFSDLARAGGPEILINATDLATGTPFPFSKFQFDLICSDLASFPVARAVAASSAFPFVISPLRLRNYGGTCGYQPPAWIKAALVDPTASSRRYQLAAAADSYLDTGKRPYIHLLDGGVADNLGLRGPLNAVNLEPESMGGVGRFDLDKSRRIIFIIVNAQAGPNLEWSTVEASPSSRDIFTAVTDAQVNRYNIETIELLREKLRKWTSSRRYDPFLTNVPEGDVKAFVVEVKLDALRSETERAYFKSLPATFNLPPDAVGRLREAAQTLLRDSSEFQRLLKDMRAP